MRAWQPQLSWKILPNRALMRETAKQTYHENLTLKEACFRAGYMPMDKYDRIVRPEKMTAFSESGIEQYFRILFCRICKTGKNMLFLFWKNKTGKERGHDQS